MIIKLDAPKFHSWGKTLLLGNTRQLVIFKNYIYDLILIWAMSRKNGPLA